MSIPNDFMTEINKVIRTNSKDTAVTFLRLPEPPRNKDKEAFRMYQLLKIQSENLPPVMYVHGIKTVVSASLWNLGILTLLKNCKKSGKEWD